MWASGSAAAGELGSFAASSAADCIDAPGAAEGGSGSRTGLSTAGLGAGLRTGLGTVVVVGFGLSPGLGLVLGLCLLESKVGIGP